MAGVVTSCGGDDGDGDGSGGASGNGESGNGSSGMGSSGMGGSQDGDVDWTQLTIEPAVMYSAFIDGGNHTFQVPAMVPGVQVPVDSWSSDPADAVSFDPDPEGGGVLITVEQPVASVTIRARNGDLGGTAMLFITEATQAEWETGEQRYTSGGEFTLPMMSDFSRDDAGNLYYMGEQVLMAMGFEMPTDLRCNNCHGNGASYFMVQHSPTQVSSYSDDDLVNIFTMGMKPPGAEFKVLPPFFAPIYEQSHTWDATADEARGLVVYLRSLTPTAQGEVMLPGGGMLPNGIPGVPGGGM